MTQRRIYQTEFPYFVTTAVRSRLPFFEDDHHATLLQAVILDRTAALHCDLFGYATLLDHVHLLIKPSEEANISKIMQQIKSSAARNLRLHANVLEKFWQPRFNFRIVNDEKRFRNTVAYLSNNHLKHGLNAKYARSPYLYIDDESIRRYLG
ncbi:MAG: transposase [Nitrospirae bacterium]|nr:transposase [Nitrospirota bacterium]